MTTRSRRRSPALLGVPVLFAGLALSACGTTTIDPKSGEDLIRNDVNRIGAATVKSVSCPSGEKPNDGVTFDCKVVLVDKATGTDAFGHDHRARHGWRQEGRVRDRRCPHLLDQRRPSRGYHELSAANPPRPYPAIRERESWPAHHRSCASACLSDRRAPPDGDEAQLAELSELLRTAGVAAVGEMVQRREHPHPNTYLGPGKLEELKADLSRADANLVACDDELSPRQERNLEAALGAAGDRPHRDHPRHLRRPRP